MGFCFSENKKRSIIKRNQHSKEKDNYIINQNQNFEEYIDNNTNDSNKNIHQNICSDNKFNAQIINNCELNKTQNINNNTPKGLINLQLNCYMNSLLQCLYYIKDFRDYFIKNIGDFKEGKPVCQELAKIMYNLKFSKKENVDPSEFKNIMAEKNNLFLGIKPGDSKDLLINLIDSLLNELSNDRSQSSSIISCNNLNKEQIFKEAVKEIDKKCIINQIFIGFYGTEYNCPKNRKVYSFETSSFILFSLENIYNYYKQSLSIKLCFEYNYLKEKNNSFYCSYCKKTHNNKSIDKIYLPQKILVIVLDRGKGKTFKKKVKFEIKLNIELFIDRDNYNNYSPNYELIGVITHSGESSSIGHYTACCLADIKKYYYFSDEYIKPIDDENKLNINEPYILFYKNINNQNYINEIN